MELSVKIEGIVTLVDSSAKEPNKLTGGLEQRSPLGDGDAVCEGPRELLEGADEALVRALGALLGEGRLQEPGQPYSSANTDAMALTR